MKMYETPHGLNDYLDTRFECGCGREHYASLKFVSVRKDAMEDLIAKWAQAGVVGLKTDYFESDEPEVLQVMQNVAECCARNRLMVLYHGCVRPGGECRTYPNILSTEAVYGEENHETGRVKGTGQEGKAAGKCICLCVR